MNRPPPFWRAEPLTDAECRLFTACLAAHEASATRGNISGQAVAAAAVGSGNYGQAIAAGLMTLGGMHGPIEETVAALTGGAVVRPGRKVPGWGNSFHKGVPDPLWTEVAECLENACPAIARRIEGITDALQRAGKKLYPNPSCYTAATALVLGMPAALAPYLFLKGRLDAWSALIFQQLKPT